METMTYIWAVQKLKSEPFKWQAYVQLTDRHYDHNLNEVIRADTWEMFIEHGEPVFRSIRSTGIGANHFKLQELEELFHYQNVARDGEFKIIPAHMGPSVPDFSRFNAPEPKKSWFKGIFG